MSGLVINHGNPWWLSPDVWIVPADNSSEPSPGDVSPAVGAQYFATANITNVSKEDIVDATVYFWWADPSLGIITSVNANIIGTSSVSVPVGETVNTLELVPWVPSFVNGGHECIIAAVVVGGGPPPAILDGTNDPTVAQRNLGVVETGAQMHGRFHYAFRVCNPSRIAQTFCVGAQVAPLEEGKRFLKAVRGHVGHEHRAAKPVHLGFVTSACPDPAEHATARPVLEGIKLAPFSCTGFSLVGQLTGGTALVHVTQRIGDRIVGGLSIFVIAKEEIGR